MKDQNSDLLDKKIHNFLNSQSAWKAYGRYFGGYMKKNPHIEAESEREIDYELINWHKSQRVQSLWKSL